MFGSLTIAVCGLVLASAVPGGIAVAGSHPATTATMTASLSSMVAARMVSQAAPVKVWAGGRFTPGQALQIYADPGNDRHGKAFTRAIVVGPHGIRATLSPAADYGYLGADIHVPAGLRASWIRLTLITPDGHRATTVVYRDRSARPSAASVTFMNECGANNPVQAPRSFTVACADAGTVLTHLTWSRWGSASATAQGMMSVNDCIPNCAAGRFHNYPVRVRVWNLRHLEATQVYTRLSYTFPGGTPGGFPRTTTTTLPR